MDYEEDTVQYASEAETIPHALEICEKTKTESLSIPMDEESHSSTLLKNTMLDHLANSKVAHFKSQQVGEPELSFEQKRQIAEDILIRNPGQFLSRFGQFLQSQHLDYFTEINKMSENYEVTFYLQQLRRFHCKTTNEVIINLNSICS
jgi:aspartyl/asparaginyl-tRNA synthetase